MIYKGKRAEKRRKVILSAVVIALVAIAVCLCAFLLSDQQIPEKTDRTVAAAELPAKQPAAAAAEPQKKATETNNTATQTDKKTPVSSETSKPKATETQPPVKKEDPTPKKETAPENETAERKPLPTSKMAVKAMGIVNTAEVNLREKAQTGKVLSVLSKGNVVAVTAEKDGWYAVKYNEQSGYVAAEYLDIQAKAELNTIGKVTADALNVRTEPKTSGTVLCQAGKNATFDVTGFENGWYAVTTNFGSGYVDAQYLTIGVPKPAEKKPKTEPAKETAAQQTAAAATVSYSGTGADLAATAQQYLGCSYTYGGSGPSSFDCSGLTMYVYGLYGVSLPHGATGQMSYGTAVDKSNLAPGDLVFFSYGGDAIGHVGIYIGDGNFVHASTYGVGVITSSLDSGSYPSRYVGARRIL